MTTMTRPTTTEIRYICQDAGHAMVEWQNHRCPAVRDAEDACMCVFVYDCPTCGTPQQTEGDSMDAAIDASMMCARCLLGATPPRTSTEATANVRSAYRNALEQLRNRELAAVIAEVTGRRTQIPAWQIPQIVAAEELGLATGELTQATRRFEAALDEYHRTHKTGPRDQAEMLQRESIQFLQARLEHIQDILASNGKVLVFHRPGNTPPSAA